MSENFRALIVGGPFHGVKYEACGAPPQRLELRLSDGKAVHQLHAGSHGLYYHFVETLRRSPKWRIDFVGLPRIDGYSRQLDWPPPEAADRVVLRIGPEEPVPEDVIPPPHLAVRQAEFELRQHQGHYRYHFVGWK